MQELGQSSDAAIAMELGCDGVLINTAIAKAKNPSKMAEAMKLSVIAGRHSYLAGRINQTIMAEDLLQIKELFSFFFG